MEINNNLTKFIKTSNKGNNNLDLVSRIIEAKKATRNIFNYNIAKNIKERKIRYMQKEENPYKAYYIITQLKNVNTSESIENKFDISEVDPIYQVLLSDSTIQNPFIINSELIKIINKYTRDYSSREAKAKAIFYWIEENISYGDSHKQYGYRNTVEVLANKQGVCGEMVFLYITMSRSVNLRSNYVSVEIDCTGKRVNHACAVVETERGKVFVDPAYHTYDIQHKKVYICSDREVIERYNQWRL
jgi:transglutaminase-like putative cysteine protease